MDAAVQVVVQTIEEAVQADPAPHHCDPSHGVQVLAEQAGLPLPASVPHHHRLEDLLCRDTEYLGQLSRVADRDRLDRDREREKDLDDFTKMLEDSFKK